MDFEKCYSIIQFSDFKNSRYIMQFTYLSDVLQCIKNLFLNKRYLIIIYVGFLIKSIYNRSDLI